MEKEENVSFAELLDNSMKEVKLEKTVTGKIIEITSKGEIFVDLGYKADGIIPKSEYSFNESDNPNDEFKIGDSITADVLKMNDGLGNVLLSYKRTKSRNVKDELEKAFKENIVIESKIKEVIDKGFIVDYKGTRIFIPLSLSGITRNESIEEYRNKNVKFKIIEFEPKQRKIIGSIKVVADEQREAEANKFWSEIEIGKHYDGIVTSISSYGAFVSLGQVQGLLHVSELSWDKGVNPNDILTVNQTIGVSIIDLDRENKRIKLSYDGKGENPWNNIEKKYNVNDIVKTTIVKIMPFGVFVKLEDGIEGLVHISQLCEEHIAKPEEKFRVGQCVNAKIIDINKETNKMELSIKDLEGTSDEYIEE